MVNKSFAHIAIIFLISEIFVSIQPSMKTLKEACKSVGMTLTALGREVGVSPNYLSQMNSGIRRPKIDLALDIQDATNGAFTCEMWRQTENKEGDQSK